MTKRQSNACRKEMTMGKESAFNPKNLQTINPERRNVLEELNLPPQVISFLQKNSRPLLVGAICLILAILGAIAYHHYTSKRRGEAADLLAQAINAPAGKQQTELLRKISTEYSGTSAALWSRVQQAHTEQNAGKEKEAIAGYQAVLAELDTGNPLIPLLHYSLGQSYETAGQPEKALNQYQQLATIPGFAVQGLLAVGRINEAQNRPTDAIEAYEKLTALKEQPLLDKGFVANKLATLQAQASADQEPK
jgi:predicted negative regulator of RcsB-dependent stress response